MRTRSWAGTLAAMLVLLSGLSGCILQPTPTPTLPPATREVATPTLPPVPTVPSSTPTSPPVPTAPSATAVPTASPTAAPPARLAPVPTAAPSPAATSTPHPVISLPPGGSRPASFASYPVISSTAAPQVKPYAVDSDLGNVEIHPAIALSPEARALLAKHAFVVTPGEDREFFHLYERLSYDRVPAFITTDSVLHVYHLLFDKLLRDIEREELAPSLIALTDAMLPASLSQHEQLKGTPLEGAARRNVAFFAVAHGLLHPESSVPPPALVRDLVMAELKLVDAHAGMAISPIFGYREDYTQYIPRGHYTRSERLKDYFRAAMWYGRMTFHASPNSAEALDQTRSALLAVSALATAGGGSALEAWEQVYDTTVFFVGTSDDLTYYEYRDLAEEVFGAVDHPAAFADEARLLTFATRAYALRPPQINSMVVGMGDREEQTKGYRFLGQRFVLDAAIFQRLVEREVTGRWLPRALDLPTALGSKEAYAILEAMGETKYDGYPKQIWALQEVIRSLPAATWVQNLYWSWLHSLRPLLEVRGEGYPTFMRNPAWVRKDLNTFLGSWTELKHDTILYAKQVYAERGDGVDRVPRGYVEPNVDVYGRLAALTQMTRQGLADRLTLSESNDQLLDGLSDLLLWLKGVSERELAGQEPTELDYRRIEAYGATLESFTIAAADPEDPNAPKGRTYIESLDAAIVADVATDAFHGLVLEEGIGRVFAIYVVVPVGDRLQVNKGGVFSYYEFEEPMGSRLTDEAWRQRLDEGKAPDLPPWTEIYRAPAVQPNGATR